MNWLDENEFVSAVKAVPLVSADLVVLNAEGQMLLGLRRNAPARGWWFTPGGRVRKNEPFVECLQRVAITELGLTPQQVAAVSLMGVWDHFYEDSAFDAGVSTHYVNLPHLLRLEDVPDLDALPLDQHSGWRWQDPRNAAVADDVHPYVRVYAKWVIDHA